MNKKVLVIVVSYNGMRWLDRCLSSVADEAGLYVFDNDSTDGSADFVAAHYPQAKLVRSAENLGFSKPNNLGFEYAVKHGYDYVYLLNQDAWLEPGALGKLVAAAEAHPEYGVLSPLQMTDGYKDLDRQFAKCYKKKITRLMAAHWLVPVGAIRAVGPFNEELFPLYGQDDDWCNRARFAGWKLGVVPEARAVHDRAYRQEAKERVVFRNYYTGSLVRLVNPGRPLCLQAAFVLLFTLVKAVKYRSFLPFKYFRTICGQWGAVKASRARAMHAR